MDGWKEVLEFGKFRELGGEGIMDRVLERWIEDWGLGTEGVCRRWSLNLEEGLILRINQDYCMVCWPFRLGECFIASI